MGTPQMQRSERRKLEQKSENFSHGVMVTTVEYSDKARWLHAVASWTWDAQDETCGICRMAFDGCCPNWKLPGDDCPLIWGACNHAFHLHCILKWVNSQTPQAHCPMCRREWQFKG
ncbi:anaphase-promoting complex subunit 11-like [Telopea speciosissima]|uniref:anaphase-promoting complex subunit 11-like n=1 Tax=Telopea speciosissima TaxID=54955 RepID=UPI001CC73BBC|nr:anaphase-promoting complex subunit 11-like [Telopea speciosissima]